MVDSNYNISHCKFLNNLQEYILELHLPPIVYRSSRMPFLHKDLVKFSCGSTSLKTLGVGRTLVRIVSLTADVDGKQQNVSTEKIKPAPIRIIQPGHRSNRSYLWSARANPLSCRCVFSPDSHFSPGSDLVPAAWQTNLSVAVTHRRDRQTGGIMFATCGIHPNRIFSLNLHTDMYVHLRTYLNVTRNGISFEIVTVKYHSSRCQVLKNVDSYPIGAL